MTHRADPGLTFLPPNEADLAYLAGLLDGEGHFKSGTRFKAAGRNQGVCGVIVTMTDRGAIDWLERAFGGRVFKNGRSARGRTVYGWRLNRQEDLRYLLPLLLPFLKVKGPQAWALLRVVETLRAQPQYAMPSSHLHLGSRVANAKERAVRKARRLRWRYEVALAQQSVLEARRALTDCNPPTQ